MPRPASAGLKLLRAAAWPLAVFLMTAAVLRYWLPARPAFALPGDETFIGFSARGRATTLVSIKKAREKDGVLYHDGPVRVRDLTTGRETGRFAGGERRLHRIVLSPSGSVLATQEWSDSMEWKGSALRLWDVGTGRRLAEFQAYGRRPEPYIVGSCFSPDSNLFAYLPSPEIRQTGKDKQPDVEAIAVWDIAGGRRRALIQGVAWFAPFAFSPDGRTLAVTHRRTEPHAGKEGRDVFSSIVRLWDIDKGTERAVLRVASAPYEYGVPLVRSLSFTPDGRTLATGTSASTPAGSGGDFPAQVKLWDANTGLERVLIDTRQYGDVTATQFTADGRFLLARFGGVGVMDSTQHAYFDLTTSPPRQVGGLFGAVAFHPGRKLVAAANVSDLGAFGELFGASLGIAEVRQEVTMLGPARGDRPGPWTIDGRGDVLRPLAFSPDGGTLALGESSRPGAPWYSPARWFLTEQRVRLHDVPSGRPGAWSPGAGDARFSPDGAALVTSGSDTPVMSHTPEGDPFYTYVRGAPVRIYHLPARPDMALVLGASAVAALVAAGAARGSGALRSRGLTAAVVVALVASGFARVWGFLRRYRTGIVVVSVLAIVVVAARTNRYRERAVWHLRRAEFYSKLADTIEHGAPVGGVDSGSNIGPHRMPDGSALRVVGYRPNTRIYYPHDAPTPADWTTTQRLIQICRRESSRQGWRHEQCERATFRPWLTVPPDPPTPPGVATTVTPGP